MGMSSRAVLRSGALVSPVYDDTVSLSRIQYSYAPEPVVWSPARFVRCELRGSYRQALSDQSGDVE